MESVHYPQQHNYVLIIFVAEQPTDRIRRYC
jgi:hypothetical protein